MRWGISRSRIKIQDSIIGDVLKVWRLNDQRGTQEFMKIGQKCFRRKLEKHSSWNVRKWRIEIKMIYYCLKQAHKIRWRISRSRIKSYESMIDGVLKVWRLNDQSGTQEFLKIGQKCFRRKLQKLSRKNVRKWSIGIKMRIYCRKEGHKMR